MFGLAPAAIRIFIAGTSFALAASQNAVAPSGLIQSPWKLRYHGFFPSLAFGSAPLSSRALSSSRWVVFSSVTLGGGYQVRSGHCASMVANSGAKPVLDAKFGLAPCS